MNRRSMCIKSKLLVALGWLYGTGACGEATTIMDGSSTGVPPPLWTTGESTPTTGDVEESEGGTMTAGPRPEEQEAARISVQIVDDVGNVIEGARVDFRGVPSASGAGGLVDLVVPVEALNDRLVIRVSASGHTTSTAVFEGVTSDAGLLRVVVLHTLGEPVLLPAALGGVVERDGLRVEFPPAAFIAAGGEAVTGVVEVTLVAIDPTQTGALARMPGPLAAVRSDKTAAELEPMIMAEISVWQGGQRLQLAPGKAARMSFEIPAALDESVRDGQSIEAWWYDDLLGIWREEGRGEIKRQGERYVWVVDATHFTWWNCDVPWTEKNCYDVTVLDSQGMAVMNMLVTAAGVDYQGMTSDYTNASGRTCVEAKRGGAVQLQAGFFPQFLTEIEIQGDPLLPGTCGGIKACVPIAMMLPGGACYPGVQEPCYPGAPETRGIGLCESGTRTLLGDCTWSACMGAVLPLAEDCLTPNVDEDCDGLAGVADGCVCVPGSVVPCWHADPTVASFQKEEVGICHGGTAACADDGQVWSACEGMVPALDEPIAQELCGDGLDNDCSGAVDDGCACDEGTKQLCYEGNAEDLDSQEGICTKGKQACIGGQWGDCEDQVLPQAEQCLTPSDEDCDGDPACCGDGVVNGEEECDDGNLVELDGCEADCSLSIVQIETGWYHSSVLLADGSLRSWGGENTAGGLGYGNYENIGDQWKEMPPPAVDVGAPVRQISIGAFGTTCALLDGGQVKCWGANNRGQLGYGDTINRGGESPPSSIAPVEVGGTVDRVSVGAFHVCALLVGGEVRCWGDNPYGELGQGHTQSIGDDETPVAAPLVSLAAAAVDVQAGDRMTCALLVTGAVQCWGNNNVGQLGQGHTDNIGDDESVTGLVELGEKVSMLAVGGAHVCVVLESGTVRCWGFNDLGQLGVGSTANIGDDEKPLSQPPVAVGDKIVRLWAGNRANYSLHPDGSMRCWGYCFGQEVMPNIGDEPGEMPPPKLILEGPVRRFNIGRMSHHACAAREDGLLQCWGFGPGGALGYPYVGSLGDAPDEMPPELTTDVF